MWGQGPAHSRVIALTREGVYVSKLAYDGHATLDFPQGSLSAVGLSRSVGPVLVLQRGSVHGMGLRCCDFGVNAGKT